MLQSLDTLIAFALIMTVTSLFVTIIVQMLSAALSLRGKNLANALAVALQTVDPSLGARAHRLAARILSDPLLSDSTRTEKSKSSRPAAIDRTKPWHFANPFGAMRLANAIRPQEVYAAIKHLASTPAAETRVPSPGEARPANAVESAAKGTVESARPDPLSEDAQSVLKALGASADMAEVANTQTEAVLKIAETLPDASLKETLLNAGQERSARTRLETCFNIAQDRAQQWFQLHTRGLAIGASVVVALVLQLDAVEVFHYVSTNAADRAALVANAQKVIKEADGTFDEKGGLIRRIADAWNAGTNHADFKIESLAGITHTGQLEDAIAKLYAEKPNPALSWKELDDDYNKLVATTTRAYYRDQSQKLADLTKDVSATGFDLMPVGFWRWPSPPPAGSHLQSFLNIGPHLFGILLFAALLTLGAPYWYNLLKNLASLRPALSQLIGKEETDQTKRRKLGNG
jgi:hypothetical protein